MIGFAGSAWQWLWLWLRSCLPNRLVVANLQHHPRMAPDDGLGTRRSDNSIGTNSKGLRHNEMT